MKTVGKTGSRAADAQTSPSRPYAFPHHTQGHPMSCGPTCLRMLVEWAGGECWSEVRLRELSGIKNGLCLRPHAKSGPDMRRALKKLASEACGSFESVDLSTLASGPSSSTMQVDTAFGDDGYAAEDRVLLLCVASYVLEDMAEPRASVFPANVGHWLMVRLPRRMRWHKLHVTNPALPTRNDGRCVCVVNDPAWDQPYFQAWDSIVGQGVVAAWRITRLRRAASDPSRISMSKGTV